jgi:Zn-finger nucleic acid-binding protein
MQSQTESRTLSCPRDASALTEHRVQGIPVDRCDTCQGIWLDLDELDALEATEADADERRATVQFSQRPSELSCPVCGRPMQTFNYRAHSLELETCDEHGYWLDHGEDRQVLQVIQERKRSLRRVPGAEAAWDSARSGTGTQGGSIVDRIRRFLRM